MSLPWQRRRPFLAILSLAAVVFSVQAARNLPVRCPAAVAGGGTPRRRTTGVGRVAARLGHAVSRASGVGLVGALAACVLVVALVGANVSGFSPSSDGYPVDGASFVESHYPGSHLFNEYAWGGYLIDRLYPNTPVFIDGRADFYGGGILGDVCAYLEG